MDTQFMNTTMYSSNKDLYSNNTLQKYNVIENAGLQSELINKPYKLVFYKINNSAETTPEVFELNMPLKDVVSVKLLTAYAYGQHINKYDFSIIKN